MGHVHLFSEDQPIYISHEADICQVYAAHEATNTVLAS